MHRQDRQADVPHLCVPLIETNVQAWASAHRGKWGQLWKNGVSSGKMGEKLKSENIQKRAVIYVYVIF